MAVQLPALSSTSELTYANLKQFATDQLGDRTDAKALRRAGRAVNQALRRLVGQRLWAWHLRRHRMLFRPRIQYSNACSMSAEGNTVTLLSGSWDSGAANYTFYFSGDTELMRVRRRDSSTQITTFSTDVYVATAATSGGTGFLVRDRYDLGVNFRCIAEDIHQKDFFGPDSEIARSEMLHLNQTYTPSSGSPINYIVELNPYTQRWELQVWQWPSRLNSADFYYYIWPVALASDTDVFDWDPNQSAVVYAAVHLKCIEELRKWDEFPAASKAYRDELTVAVNTDRKTLVTRVAGARPARVKRMQLNRLFTNAT